ncbi:uncharacterized protein LOC117172853 [Belonocnema kinseyi]|uniref:uncharacterized protein LOC117172853 n=1 Tax=Belonocnema kinseyi TaxID=2817044 RepID=UPI00143CFD2A|nr:uncharacterized protein LOC117172853 [Belonocnema kinseyi]
MISPGMSSCEHSLNTLRYADRVKELAVTDPTEVKVSPTDEEQLDLKIEEQSNNSVLSDSDLAQLRSLNEGEISQDLYTFHEAVSALQLLEEEVLDTHKTVVDSTTTFLNDAHSIFSATHEVDYDQEDSRARSIHTLRRSLSFHITEADASPTTLLKTKAEANNRDLLEAKISNRGDGMPIVIKSPWKNEADSDCESDSGFDWCSNSGCSVDSENFLVEKKPKSRSKYSWTGTFRKKKRTSSVTGSSKRNSLANETAFFVPFSSAAPAATNAILSDSNCRNEELGIQNAHEESNKVLGPTKADLEERKNRRKMKNSGSTDCRGGGFLLAASSPSTCGSNLTLRFESISPPERFAAVAENLGNTREIIEKNDFTEEDQGDDKEEKAKNLQGQNKRERSRVSDFAIAVVKNVIIFSVLPAFYVLLFVYAHKSPDKTI